MDSTIHFHSIPSKKASLHPFRIAISPCPNDTFGFSPLLTGKVSSEIPFKASLYDIETLNTLAQEGSFDLIKMSSCTFAQVQDRYALLPVGSAVSKNFGPLLISKNKYLDLNRASIAIPGRNTTAYALYQMLYGTPEKTYQAPYNQILQMVLDGIVDAGIIIHETRFLIPKTNVHILKDLGKTFYSKYHIPIPLGVIGINKHLSEKIQHSLNTLISSSFAFARQNPNCFKRFIKFFAQEKKPTIIQKHIQAFVTKETYNLTTLDIRNLREFFSIGSRSGLFNPNSQHFQVIE